MKESEEVKQYQLSDDSKYNAIEVDNKFIHVVVHLNNFNNNLISLLRNFRKSSNNF